MSGRTRRLVAATAFSIVVVATIIATYAAISEDDLTADLRPLSRVPAPLVTAVFFATPGAIAAVGALRRSNLVVVIAGASALLESFLAFSGVTFGFILPAVVLIYLGARDAGSGATSRRPRDYAMGLLPIAFLIGAWAVVLGNTETTCWIASAGPDGGIVYRTIPDTGILELGVEDLGGSCDTEPTVRGLVGAGGLLLASVGVAWLAGRPKSA